MKTKNACLFVLFFFVISNFLAVGQSLGNGWGYGDGTSPYFDPFTPKAKNLLKIAPFTGGVAFANIAEPLSGTTAVGKPLSLRYDRNKADGKRLEVLVGDNAINTGLYDWELVPLTRFVEVDSWSCVSLIADPDENDSLSLFEKALEMCQLEVDDIASFRNVAIKYKQLQRVYMMYTYKLLDELNNNDREVWEVLKKELDELKSNNPLVLEILFYTLSGADNLSDNDQEVFVDFIDAIMWASYNPGMGNTLVGLNLLLVDAMFVGSKYGDPTIMNDIIAQVNGLPKISGYNDKPAKRDSPSSELLEILVKEKWETYIYSDANFPIYYWVDGNEIKFSGFPFYQFMYVDNKTGEYKYSTELNNYMRLNYPAIKALNPVIYNAAEKWCQWSALFRAAKNNNKGAWERFIKSVEAVYPFVPSDLKQTKYPEPYIKTPRFWIPGL